MKETRKTITKAPSQARGAVLRARVTDATSHRFQTATRRMGFTPAEVIRQMVVDWVEKNDSEKVA